MTLFTDPHYFKNVEKSQVTPIQGENTNPPSYNSTLLLIVKWEESMMEYVYKTHSIFIDDVGIEVIPYEERMSESSEEIINRFIKAYKDRMENKEENLEGIIACNPHEYSIGTLASQCI